MAGRGKGKSIKSNQKYLDPRQVFSGQITHKEANLDFNSRDSEKFFNLVDSLIVVYKSDLNQVWFNIEEERQKSLEAVALLEKIKKNKEIKSDETSELLGRKYYSVLKDTGFQQKVRPFYLEDEEMLVKKVGAEIDEPIVVIGDCEIPLEELKMLNSSFIKSNSTQNTISYIPGTIESKPRLKQALKDLAFRNFVEIVDDDSWRPLYKFNTRMRFLP